MKVEIDEVTDRCDRLLIQLLPDPETPQLVTRQQGGGGRWLECQSAEFKRQYARNEPPGSVFFNVFNDVLNKFIPFLAGM